MKEKFLSINASIPLTAIQEAMVFAGISILSFFIPFIMGYPQWLVGTIINACLFSAVLFLPKKYFLPVTVLPSLGILARGVIFGLFTPFLVYFLPFIWLSNIILIVAFTLFISQLDKKNRIFLFLSVFAAASLKFFVLYLTANLYLNFKLVPAVFLQTMGLNQLATGIAGGIIATLIYGKFNSRSQRAD